MLAGGAVGEAELDDALPARLAHLAQTRALQVFTQEHDEGGRLGDKLARFALDEVQAGDLGLRRGQQPAVARGAFAAKAAVTLEGDGLRRRLDHVVYARADEACAELVDDGGEGEGVYLHTC